MVSTVWSVSCLLFFYSRCPSGQPFLKVGKARAPVPHEVGATDYINSQKNYPFPRTFFFNNTLGNYQKWKICKAPITTTTQVLQAVEKCNSTQGNAVPHLQKWLKAFPHLRHFVEAWERYGNAMKMECGLTV